jgi:hypothetical protein
MDIERFDRLYPTPAHAAAADLGDRYASKTRTVGLGQALRDRSGATTIIAGLAAALLGSAGYVLMAGGERAPDHSIHSDIPSRAPRPAVLQTAPRTALVTPIVSDHAPSGQPAKTLGDDRLYRVSKKRSYPNKRSSKWIADPLYGDALAAALVVDKQRTVELNAEQLQLMATNREEERLLEND